MHGLSRDLRFTAGVTSRYITGMPVSACRALSVQRFGLRQRRFLRVHHGPTGLIVEKLPLRHRESTWGLHPRDQKGASSAWEEQGAPAVPDGCAYRRGGDACDDLQP